MLNYSFAMKMKSPAIICLILQLTLTETQEILSITSNLTFPHFIDNSFSIGIQALANDSKLTTDPNDTMVIRIADLNFTEFEKGLLNYGAQDAIDEEIQGKLMDIKVWEKNPSSTAINISIMFKRGAHKKYLEIFYFSAPNKYQRRKYLKNPLLAKRLFHELIELFIPSTLALSVIPMQNKRKEIIINDLVVVCCRAFDGIPQYEPRFDNYAHLNVTETKYNKVANEIRMTFRASVRDHLNNFSCSAGNVTETFTIRIHHHPSEIRIRPDNNEILQRNRTMQCYSPSGYPPPIIRIHLTEGPSNASQYYETRGNGSQIYINSNAPIGSVWKWKCSMKSTIVNVTESITKEVAFKVASHPTAIRIKPMPNGIMEPNSTIDCAPSDGYPVAAAKWEVIDGPENASLYYNIARNGTQIHLKGNCPTKSQWKIKCVVQSCIENVCEILNKIISFRIANHPTALYIHPIINKRFRSKSTIKCYTSDGYPDPEINWQLIEGPPNAKQFYNISEKGHQININSNSPTGSKWTFNCIMKSRLVITKKMLNKTISFAIAKNPMEICGEKCLNARISAIEETVEENGKLHEDMRLVLSEVKEQIRRGQQEMSAEMKTLIKEQQEISKRTNNTQKQLEILVKRFYESVPFRFTFSSIYYQRYSPWFTTINSLSVRISAGLFYGTLKIYLSVQGPPSISVDLNIQCQINAVKTPTVIKTVTFNLQYRGSEVDSEPVDYSSYETFGRDLINTGLTIACHPIF